MSLLHFQKIQNPDRKASLANLSPYAAIIISKALEEQALTDPKAAEALDMAYADKRVGGIVWNAAGRSQTGKALPTYVVSQAREQGIDGFADAEVSELSAEDIEKTRLHHIDAAYVRERQQDSAIVSAENAAIDGDPATTSFPQSFRPVIGGALYSYSRHQDPASYEAAAAMDVYRTNLPFSYRAAAAVLRVIQSQK